MQGLFGDLLETLWSVSFDVILFIGTSFCEFDKTNNKRIKNKFNFNSILFAALTQLLGFVLYSITENTCHEDVRCRVYILDKEKLKTYQFFKLPFAIDDGDNEMDNLHALDFFKENKSAFTLDDLIPEIDLK